MDFKFQFDYSRLMSPKLAFDSDFENGSMDRAVRLGLDWYHIVLRQDTWYRFHFRVRGCKGRQVIFEFTCRNIRNPGMDEGRGRWLRRDGERLVKPLVSYDRKTWRPVEHIEKHPQDRGKYRFVHTFAEDEAYLCHHHPYTYSDLLEWLQTIRGNPLVKVEKLGHTRNGIPQPVLTFADGSLSKDLVVLIGREDADEASSSWGIEGLVRGLLATESRELLKRHTFKVVPMVGIDGVVAGAHHSAGYGYGGHRWHQDPSPAEIENVKQAIKAWTDGGHALRLAGKLHGSEHMPSVLGPDRIKSASLSVSHTLSQGIAEHYRGAWRPPEHQPLEIRPKGYFERFVLDEFGLYDVFTTHIRGATPEDNRSAGEAVMNGIALWLGDEGPGQGRG